MACEFPVIFCGDGVQGFVGIKAFTTACFSINIHSSYEHGDVCAETSRTSKIKKT